MSYQKDREDFIAACVEAGHSRNAAGPCAALARHILKDAATVQRLATEACNRELSPREHAKDVAACGRIHMRAALLGAEADVQGDPRGACVKLRFQPGNRSSRPANSFGGEGWYCVPTRNY